MENKEIFKITLNKVGFDPYDENSNFYVMSKPKQQFTIKKIKGFKRVVNIGWSYIIEKL